MRLLITPLARQDIEAIGDYIAQDDPVHAMAFVEALRHQCQRIAAQPLMYRLRPELGVGLRSCPHGRYVIFFSVQEDAVRIVRVLHGARDLLVALRQAGPGEAPD